MTEKIGEILKHFNISGKPEPLGNGHINETYLVRDGGSYVVQKINKNVFRDPVAVMENVRAVTKHLRSKIVGAGGDPDRETLNFLDTTDGLPYYRTEYGEYYRAYVYIDRVKSYDVAESPELLYQAARAFGRFQNMLADFPAETLHEVIPSFHDTRKRFSDFKRSVEKNASGRAGDVKDEIGFVLDREGDCGIIVDALRSGDIPVRVTHNDTKLNNVLFDENTDEGVCVIDLDTVMPGSLLYDFGDALRFAGSSGAEDEKDLSKIWFDLTNFDYFTKGFLEATPSITEKEKELLPFSVKLMTLECGMRFLADYIDGDVYFKTAYPEHNLVRARTQIKLVEDIENKLDEMKKIVNK
ncbi:MAG: aminoglycoside phosphotransferase family protein [Clostridia bacterium]|nr:aminoglycoside phosphotransferase family protein [Clostridia bacterium]MBR7033593.1 aminoglycoside phosphotransferase family protein [Clostridia bacterium]